MELFVVASELNYGGDERVSDVVYAIVAVRIDDNEGQYSFKLR
jgi:hypothetical protein